MTLDESDILALGYGCPWAIIETNGYYRVKSRLRRESFENRDAMRDVRQYAARLYAGVEYTRPLRRSAKRVSVPKPVRGGITVNGRRRILL